MGTPGDDTFNLAKLDASFKGLVDVEAGTGNDKLRLTGSGQALDLTSIAIANFTQFVYSGSGNDQFRGGYSNDMLVERSSRDKQQCEHSSDLRIGGSTKSQIDLPSLDTTLADWGSGEWALALFDLGDIIDDDDEDNLWGEKGLDMLFGGLGDKVKQ